MNTPLKKSIGWNKISIQKNQAQNKNVEKNKLKLLEEEN